MIANKVLANGLNRKKKQLAYELLPAFKIKLGKAIVGGIIARLSGMWRNWQTRMT
ncbi:MAG: hypothetical protein GY943_21925 [Chloroflexi bacterium]|nr:hypothetical protein [Chloroflexota bacterium]